MKIPPTHNTIKCSTENVRKLVNATAHFHAVKKQKPFDLTFDINIETCINELMLEPNIASGSLFKLIRNVSFFLCQCAYIYEANDFKRTFHFQEIIHSFHSSRSLNPSANWFSSKNWLPFHRNIYHSFIPFILIKEITRKWVWTSKMNVHDTNDMICHVFFPYFGHTLSVM